jgi:hypothetical protein
MRPLYRALVVVASLSVLCGVEACSESDTGAELNPQPLPPGPPEQKGGSTPGDQREPASDGTGGGTGGGSTSSGSSGGSSGNGTPIGSDGGADSGGDG